MQYKTSKPFKKITKEEKEEIKNLYNSGELIKNIAKKLNRDRVTIRKHLDSLIGKDRKQNYRITLSNDIISKIIQLNKESSIAKISKIVNLGVAIIARVLKENNIKNNHAKYEIDEDYFEKIDTPNKAYFLGLLYADGCVSNKNNSVKIVLKSSDHYILEILKNELKTDRPIHIENPKSIKNTNYISSGSSALGFSSLKMKNDLIKLGCIPKKSLILKFPTEEQVPKKLIWHFIRGYFDGDGCITNVNKNKLCTLQFMGTFEFLEKLKSIFEEKNILFNLRKEERRLTNVYYLCCYKRDKNIEVSKLIYENADIYLTRKFDIFEQWKKLSYDKRKIKKTVNN